MHRHAAIREHTEAVQRSAHAYRAENHCRCGEFVAFVPNHREPRQCFRCKTRSDIWQEVAS